MVALHGETPPVEHERSSAGLRPAPVQAASKPAQGICGSELFDSAASAAAAAQTADPAQTTARLHADLGREWKALEVYTLIWRKGCTPPDSTSWTSADHDEAFIGQTVVMASNASLSIPAAVRTARPEDHHRNAATVHWPDGANRQPLVIDGGLVLAVAFKTGRNPALAGYFARLLADQGRLAHRLASAGDRSPPPMRKLVEQPFWLDPRDPHRMRAAIQIRTRPHHRPGRGVRGNKRRSAPIFEEDVWGKAVHRAVADRSSRAPASDEAIARIEQILSEQLATQTGSECPRQLLARSRRSRRWAANAN